MKKWQGYHIYYSGDLNDLLLEGVVPLLQSLQQANLVERYFFIRYGEKGQHIRLRLWEDAANFETAITPNVHAHFKTYFNNYPSVRTTEQPDFYPNDSVQLVEYTPEIDRYGGAEGVELAENLFCHSAQTVLLLLQQGALEDYESTLGVAIQLHLALVFQLQYAPDEAHQLFRQVYQQWLGVFRKANNDTEWDLLRKMQQQFEFQKESIVPYVQHLWNHLAEDETYEDFWFHFWNRSIQQFYPLFSKANLTRHEEAIIADYIHMTNNRLGVSNFDESYLAFLLMRCLES